MYKGGFKMNATIMSAGQYGGFWRRLFAFLLDEIILYFVSLILFITALLVLGLEGDILERSLRPIEDASGDMRLFGLLYIASSLLSGMIYFISFHGFLGRTPGKMALGLQVVQTSGYPITPGIAFLRWVGYLISAPLFCLGFLWVAFDGRKQGWHDKIAATVVVRSKGRTGHPLPAVPSFANADPPPSESMAQAEMSIPAAPESCSGPPLDEDTAPSQGKMA